MDRTAAKFAREAMEFPLFAGDPGKLRNKLTSAGGLLKEYWADFQKTFLDGKQSRPEMIYLPALLDEKLIPEAKGYLTDYFRTLPRSDPAGDFQFHTWCRCGSVIRRAAFFDWLASRGAWSRGEVEEAAEAFLGFGFKHAFAVLTARGRSSNNQALSMALYLAVVGFLFGYKLAAHPTGRFLFDYGVGRLPDLIGLFPGDGYGGEGSTYTSHVNTPLTYWICEFLKQITGHNYLDTPFAPNGTTLKKMLEIELRITSPSGLLAPWDHYGWQHAINASPFAYLAKVTGNPRYLSLIAALNLWKDPGFLAWGADDPLWTLVWWPEDRKNHTDAALPGDLFGWFLPKTGAALDDPQRRTRLMQVWDASAPTIAGVGRAQVNPNHLILEVGGEPVFQDGIQDGEKDPWHFPVEKVLERLKQDERDRYLSYLKTITGGKADFQKVVIGASPGLIGCANAIVVDEEPWYWPGCSRVGAGEFYAKENGLQVVTADSTSFYQPGYDVKLARRTSLWTKDGFGVVLDALEADSTHTWRWQAYLRPEVKVEGDSARIGLPGGRSVLLAWERGCTVRTEPIEGFPRTQECRSMRLDLMKKGPNARFAVVIAPGAREASIRRVGNNLIEVRVDGKRHSVVVENFARDPVTIAGSATTAVFAWAAPGVPVVEISEGAVKNVRPDIHELSDIETERDLQLPAFESLVRWDAEPVSPTQSCLSEVDTCLAQLPASHPDTAALIAALRDFHWPVQVAAAEVLGRRGCREAIPALRELLEAEHAIPEKALYPPEETLLGQRSPEEIAKRWRLKTALIIALGRLRDADAVPLLARILADSRDFYTVYSCAAQALGRIGGPEALKALGPAFTENEVNTRSRATYAKEAIETKS